MIRYLLSSLKCNLDKTVMAMAMAAAAAIAVGDPINLKRSFDQVQKGALAVNPTSSLQHD